MLFGLMCLEGRQYAYFLFSSPFSKIKKSLYYESSWVPAVMFI